MAFQRYTTGTGTRSRQRCREGRRCVSFGSTKNQLLCVFVISASVFSSTYWYYCRLFHQPSSSNRPLVVKINSSSRRSNNSSSFVAKKGTKNHLYNVCAITRIRNDYMYIKEWVEYHKILGVDQFYIADDCSDRNKDETDRILWQYEKEGLVTYSPHQPFNDCKNHSPDQTTLFQLMYNMSFGKCQWVGLWDIDEFITFSSEKYNYQSNFLLNYLNALPHGIARLVWVIMGSDGHETIDPTHLVIERYLNGAVGPCEIKSIFRWDVAQGIGGPNPAHFPLLIPFPGSDYYKTFVCRKEELKPYSPNNMEKCLIPSQPIFLRHYRSKSWEEYMLGRGSRSKNSNGVPSQWNKNPREKWNNFWIRSTCALVGKNFTAWMAKEVRTKLNMSPINHKV